ncbi:unnamed protein product, partial [Notodromas monacha]
MRKELQQLDDGEGSRGRRTRGRKINYRVLLGSDESDPEERKGNQMPDSDEEIFQPEKEDDEDEDEEEEGGGEA